MTNETTIDGWECRVDEEGDPAAIHNDCIAVFLHAGELQTQEDSLQCPVPVLRWLLDKHDELRGDSEPKSTPSFHFGQDLYTRGECVAALREGWRLRWDSPAAGSKWIALRQPGADTLVYSHTDQASPGCSLEHWHADGTPYTIVGRQPWAVGEAERAEPTEDPKPNPAPGFTLPDSIGVKFWGNAKTLHRMPDNKLAERFNLAYSEGDQGLSVFRCSTGCSWYAELSRLDEARGHSMVVGGPDDEYTHELAIAGLEHALADALGCGIPGETVAPDATDAEPAEPPITDGAEAVNRLLDAGFNIHWGLPPRCSVLGYVSQIRMGDDTLGAFAENEKYWHLAGKPHPDIRTTDDLHAALLAEIQRIVGERYGGLKTASDRMSAVKAGWRLARVEGWIAYSRVADCLVNDFNDVLARERLDSVNGPFHIVGRQWPEKVGGDDCDAADKASLDAGVFEAQAEEGRSRVLTDYPPANELDRLRERLYAAAYALHRSEYQDTVDWDPKDEREQAHSEASALLAMRGK